MSGSLARKRTVNTQLQLKQFLKDVSHESFVNTQLQLPDFQESLALHFRLHNFNFQFLREVSHESIVSLAGFQGSLARTCAKVVAMSFLLFFSRFWRLSFSFKNVF